MKHLDITFDLETTSLSSHAAIMQIAAVAWDRFAEDADHLFLVEPGEPGEDVCARSIEEAEYFCVCVDLNSQFTEGRFDFSQSTSEWWGKQSNAAKAAVLEGKLEKEALLDALWSFHGWINFICGDHDCDSVCIWCQGTDFDIPILRHAAECCGIEGECMPASLHHKYYRDCRTVIYENVCTWLGRPEGDQPYSRLDLLKDPTLAYKILPQLPESFGTRENAHGALYDAVRSTWFTWQALELTR